MAGLCKTLHILVSLVSPKMIALPVGVGTAKGLNPIRMLYILMEAEAEDKFLLPSDKKVYRIRRHKALGKRNV